MSVEMFKLTPMRSFRRSEPLTIWLRDESPHGLEMKVYVRKGESPSTLRGSAAIWEFILFLQGTKEHSGLERQGIMMSRGVGPRGGKAIVAQVDDETYFRYYSEKEASALATAMSKYMNRRV